MNLDTFVTEKLIYLKKLSYLSATSTILLSFFLAYAIYEANADVKDMFYVFYIINTSLAVLIFFLNLRTRNKISRFSQTISSLSKDQKKKLTFKDLTASRYGFTPLVITTIIYCYSTLIYLGLFGTRLMSILVIAIYIISLVFYISSKSKINNFIKENPDKLTTK